MSTTTFAALLDAVPEVPTTAFRNAFYPSTTTMNTRVHNLETGNIERWNGTTWLTDFYGVNGPTTGAAVLTGSAAPNGAVTGNPGWLYVQQVSTTASILWEKQSGTATNTGWAASAAVGTGAPEGVVTAPIGTLLGRADGSNGTVAYVKNSGTGNTGWRALQTGLGVYNVLDYGAKGDGTTDDTAAINAAMTALGQSVSEGAGGWVYFPTGVYLVSSTITISKFQVRFGGNVGASTVRSNVTLKAASSLVGPVLKIAVGAGDHGAYVANLNIDGSNAAGVTCCLEVGANQTAREYFDNLQLMNAPIGLQTDTNCQSHVYSRVYANVGVATGLVVGSNNRHMAFRDCNFNGSTQAALLGVDTSVSGDKLESCTFTDCEFYSTGTTNTVQLLNSQGCTFTQCWFETQSGTVAGLLQVGGATGAADNVLVLGGFFQGDNNAAYGIVLQNGSNPTILAPLFTSMATGMVQNVAASSTAVILLNSTNSTSVSALSGALAQSGRWYGRRYNGTGTAHVAGDYALSAGWGTTASVSAVSAKDTGGRVTIACAGTGQLANPTVTLTWKDGTWTTVPAVAVSRGDLAAPSGPFLNSTPGATTVVFTFNGTPVAGNSYILDFVAMGK